MKRAFKKHGTIESIQIFDDGYAAYITFVKDASAHSALVNIGPEKFFVRPADTWHQPSDKSTKSKYTTIDDYDEMNEELPPILQLNEDCLIELFQRCSFDACVNLANVCKPFKVILDRYFFPNIHKVHLKFDQTSLAKTRDILRCVGPHVKAIDIDTNFWLYNIYISRLLQKFCQYSGENLRELSLHHIALSIDMRMQMSVIKPILPRLTMLTIDYCHNKLQLDFVKYCTNLVKLRLCELRLGWHSTQPLLMPSLQQLIITWDDYEPAGDNYYENQTSIFNAIIAQNPQLKCVKTHLINITLSIAQSLPKLEKLSIDFSKVAGSNSEHLIHLIAIENLTKLTLSGLEVRIDNVPEILSHLVQIKKLQELKLYFENNMRDEAYYESYQTSLVSLARELPQLRKCLVQGLTLLKSTLYEFIRSGERLDAFHIHHCKLFILESRFGEEAYLKTDHNAIIISLVNARKMLTSHVSPLNLFLDLEIYNNLNADCQEYCEGYLSINRDCKHKREFVDQDDMDFDV